MIEDVFIINKIEDKVNEYKKRTGITKKFIAHDMGMSKQAMFTIMKSNNLTLTTLVKFAHALKCEPEDLYDYKVMVKDDN